MFLCYISQVIKEITKFNINSKNSIFDKIIDSDSGETNLTDALSDSVNKSEISGKILEGYHFDTGNPQGLVKASNFFLKNSKLILENY